MIPLYAGTVVNRLGRAAARMFGYDAVDTRNRRKAADGILRSEDSELTPEQRRKLVSGNRDLQRNYAVAGWIVRKHLDYVSTFNFQSKSGIEAFDKQVESLVRQQSKAEHCDIAGRHNLPRMLRMIESARTTEGDIGLVRINDGRLQAVEGDRIRTPDNGSLPAGYSRADFIHGIQCDEAGKALAYSICNRGRTSDFSPGAGSFQFERIVPAGNMWLHGYYGRFDQVRGVGLMVPAMNSLRDLYEAGEYALAKMKIAQLFGLAIFRPDSDGLATQTTDADGNVVFDFGKGPQLLDLNERDKVEFLESHSPTSEFQGFHTTTIAMAMKALDIPFSFYSENFTNFSGQRQAWIQYDLAARWKRQGNIDLLDDITGWWIALWVIQGKLTLPDGMDLSVPFWRWVPVGVPWIDPLKEVQADVAALAAGLTSRTRILKEQGQDIEEIVEELAYETKLFADRGLQTTLAPSNVQITEITPANAA